MGIGFSCVLAVCDDLERGFESAILKSINFGDDVAKTPVRSINFSDSEPTIMRSVASGKMIVERSVSFKESEAELVSVNDMISSEEKCISFTSVESESKETDRLSPKWDCEMEKILNFPVMDANNPKHEAAVKLQKVYKSFRTRRKLADCAVLIEQSWWKLLDFAELKHSSISFFDLKKHETAISRWSRARTRAAKVGKGLSENGKAQKLARQHWLEAIDPRHRYGHNLHFYFVKWLQSQSKEPFFYWLDIGEGKEVNFVEKCPRSKLQQQCIKYLGPMERKAYEVVVEDGKLYYKQTGELLDTGDPKDAKWIFVLSTSRTLYVGKKRKGTFQHSSFLAGGATSAAGRIVVEKGILKAVWPHSGHYRPTPENFQDFISFLMENNVDVTDVKMDSADEEESVGKRSNIYLRGDLSEEDLNDKDSLEKEDISVGDLLSNITNLTEAIPVSAQPPKSWLSFNFSRNLTSVEIPKKDDLIEGFRSEEKSVESSSKGFGPEYLSDDYESAEESLVFKDDHDGQKQNLSDQDQDENEEQINSEKSVLQRINSHKGMNSYQLGRQLSCKWSTGAGPRIGCLRDYPSELQFHALEQANLSPRSARCLKPNLSLLVSTQSNLDGELQRATSFPFLEKRNGCKRHSRMQFSLLCGGAGVTATDKPS